MRLLAVVFSAVLNLVFSAPVGAQPYPNQPIRLVVPFAPGGGTDAAGREMAALLTKRLGMQVFVDNRPGAGGNVGAGAVAKAAPDGYTLLVGTVGTQIVNKVIFPQTSFNPDKDLIPVALFSHVPNVLVVNSSSPIGTVADLIAHARKSGPGLAYGSGGAGTTTHLSVELLKEMADIQLTHIPYKGSAPAVTDLIGGSIHLMIDNMSSAMPHIRSGRLRALAVTTKTRQASLPGVPSLSESPGLNQYEAVGWTGLFVPRGTSKAVVAKLASAIESGKADVDLRARLAALGSDFAASSTESFGEFLRLEQNRWVPIARRVTE